MFATYERRWWTLTILCLSLVIIILGNTALNVALPTLQRELEASATALQWMVAVYSLVFAGLLLTAGALGDRFGRKGFLTLGLSIFGVASVAATQATSSGQIIVARSIMGVGAAFVMPATLSILTNVFPPRERPTAIGIWAGLAAASVGIGPIVSGYLVEHFSWSAAFYINVPVVLVALVGGWLLVPRSKDPDGHPLDPMGAVLSIAGFSALVYAMIEAPDHGWLAPSTLLMFAMSAALLGAFGLWEWRTSEPMLDLRLFRNPRFSAASGAIMVQFMAMMGMFFVLTQYLQFARGYSALAAGVYALPMPVAMMTLSSSSARIVRRFQARAVITLGMSISTIGVLGLSTVEVTSSYAVVAISLFVMGVGAGMVGAPSTTSIMASLPLGKAGVGSAVNDTTRQIGAALGVAVMGSVLASQYSASLRGAAAGLPAPARAAANAGVGDALRTAREIGGVQGPRLADAARDAYIHGMRLSLWVAAGMLAVGAFVVRRYLPAHIGSQPGPEHPPEDVDADRSDIAVVATAAES